MSRRLRATPLLYCITDVRLITFRSATLARDVRIWSCTPSVKKALSGSRLIFSNGRTATLFSGIDETDETLGAVGGKALVSRVRVCFRIAGAKIIARTARLKSINP